MSLLPDNIPLIVDYTVDKESRNGNFEGQGFNYCPMTAELGPPGLLQVFKLEQVVNNDKKKVGIKSKFGTYWRSQHWNSTVSQAPHRLGDETWTLSPWSKKNVHLDHD